MSRGREQLGEERKSRADAALVWAIEYGLPSGLTATGHTLRGLSLRVDEYETLITVRAVTSEGPKVAFVGSATIADALRKLGREAAAAKLRWREDTFAK